jgi:transcriptional regulator
VRIKMARKVMNADIRMEMAKYGIKQYEIAEKLGMTTQNFSLCLRMIIPDERRKKIFAAIEELKGE